MTARYKGMCIEGVADGHVIERDDPSITIEMQRKARTNIHLDGSETSEPMVVDKTDYRFVLLLGTTNEEIGVWVPERGLSPAQATELAIKRLVKFYNPRTGLIGEPLPNTLPIRKG